MAYTLTRRSSGLGRRSGTIARHTPGGGGGDPTYPETVTLTVLDEVSGITGTVTMTHIGLINGGPYYRASNGSGSFHWLYFFGPDSWVVSMNTSSFDSGSANGYVADGSAATPTFDEYLYWDEFVDTQTRVWIGS